MPNPYSSNFSFLERRDEQLARLGFLAEKYLTDDANTCLLKLRQFGELLARVDSCQTHMSRVPQLLKRFRQSVLAAATSGRLTEEWREKHGNSTKSWLSTIPNGGAPLPNNYKKLRKIAFKLTKIEHSADELPDISYFLSFQ